MITYKRPPLFLYSIAGNFVGQIFVLFDKPKKEHFTLSCLIAGIYKGDEIFSIVL